MKKLLLLAALFLLGGSVRADSSLPSILQKVDFEQRLNEQVPLDLVFKDEGGRSVTLAEYFHGKPVVLVLAYFRCPMLCTEVLNGMVRAMLDIPYDAGKEYEVLTVSFDARETPPLATAKKKTYVERYGRPGGAAGWHFLTGQEDAIKKLADAVGFHFTYDPRHDQFAHPSGIIVITPQGKVSRYLYGIDYSPRDLKLALMEASHNKIGSRLERAVLFFCFHYDPEDGRYGPIIMNFVRAGGVLTMLALGTFVFVMWRQERRRAEPGVVKVG